MEILTVANQKGGVGKSTTVHALGRGLSLQGRRVLFVDLDPQGNLSYSMQAARSNATTYELITDRATVTDTIQRTPQGDLIPASPLLSGADIELHRVGKEYRLKEALQPIRDAYDIILIDTPPALGILTINALAASNGVIVTAQADIFSLQGIGQLSATIDAVKTYCTPALIIKGILLTRHSSRAILSRDLTEMITDTAAQLNTTVYKTVIRECIALKEAQASRQDIFNYAPKSNAATDYAAFIEEVLGEGGKQ